MMRSAVTREAEDAPAELLRQTGDLPPSPSDENSLPDARGEFQRGESVERVARAEEDTRALPLRLAAGEWRALLGWTLLAFLLRFFLLWRLEHVISPDGVVYVNLGRSLIEGNLREGLSTYWPPLYPLLVGLASLLFRDAEFAGRFVSVVAGALLVVPAHRLIRAWYGRRIALLGASVIALHPLLLYYSTVLLNEATYTLLFTCGVLAGWSALSGGRARIHLLAGATFGACYLLKPEAAGFLLLLVAHTLIGGKLFGDKFSFKSAVRNALSLGAGFLLLALPYLLYLRREIGAWTLSGKFAGHLWQGSRRADDLAPQAGALLVPDAATAVVQLTKALRHEYEVFNLIFPVAFVLLAGLGLFRRRWTRERARRELYLFSFVVACFAGYAVTLPNIRFVVPLLPLLLCWLSKGVVEFEGWAVETLKNVKRKGVPGAKGFPARARKFVAPLVVAALLASLLPLSVYLFRGDKWSDYYGQKLAARWINEHGATREPAIMSVVPVAAFYAGGRHVALKDETPEAMVERARREGVAYVIINERNVKRMNLRALLDERAQHPAGLRLAHSLALAPDHKILVYALEAQPEQGGTPEVKAP